LLNLELCRRSYRFYLRRQCARACRTREKVWAYLQRLCAAIIEAVLRGRLGRRKARTCAYLNYVQKAHPISLSKALSLGGEFKVFWYKSKEQIRLLFNDYLVLVERTGFVPPRYVVEANIQEIAHSRVFCVDQSLDLIIHYLWRRHGPICRRAESKLENTLLSPRFSQDGAQSR